MNIITTIFTVAFEIFLGLIALAIFIQSYVDLWKEMKPEIQDWFKSTRIGMWHSNRKNKVKILSKKEYSSMVMNGKIKSTIMIDEQ